jgi:hypothetical protein
MLNAIEITCVDAYRTGTDPLPVRGGGDNIENWIRFGIRLLLDAGRMVRHRYRSARQPPSKQGHPTHG